MAAKTSLLIDFDNIIKPNQHSKLISKIQPIPDSKHNIGLVLVIPPEQLVILERIPKGDGRVAYLNTDSFVSTISGYAYLIYDKQKKVCEVTGIHGFVMRQVLVSVLSGIPNDVTLWVGIALDDTQLPMIIEEYVSAGFTDPYICKESPLGFIFPYYGLCMLKDNDVTEANATNDVAYVLEQFVKMEEQNCFLSLRLAPDSIKYLKQLSKIGSTLNDNGSISQKEISGTFTISEADAQQQFSLSVNRSSIVSGEEEGASVAKGLYVFHTHPQEAYDRHQVSLGWPSAQDYVAFISSVIEYKTILHAVIALEGVYFLSISNYWVDKLENLDDDAAEFILKTYNIDHGSGKDVNEYLREVNTISYKGYPIFLIHFFPWSDASTLITIPFRREGVNCFANDRTLKKYVELY